MHNVNPFPLCFLTSNTRSTRDASVSPSARFPPALNIVGCTLVLPDAEVAWWRYVSSDIADGAAVPDNW